MSEEIPQSSLDYRAAQEQLFKMVAAGLSSSAPMRTSFINAAQCLSIITFPPISFAKRICEELIPAFAAVDPHHHYYPAESLHLTVRGIRAAASPADFTGDEAIAAGKVLRRIAPRLPRLEFTLDGLARFPTSLVLRAFSTTAFRDSVHLLDKVLMESGVTSNKIYASKEAFIGNLTFCRFTTPPSAQLLDCVRRFETDSFGRFVADTLQLVSCDEVCSLESRRDHVTVHCGKLKATGR